MEGQQEEPKRVPSAAQQRRAAHKQRVLADSGEERRLKAEYYKIRATEAFVDLMKQLEKFVAYHTKVAKDGVGLEDRKHEDGSITQEVVRLTPEQRVSEIDKAAGIEEIIGYVSRKLAVTPVKSE